MLVRLAAMSRYGSARHRSPLAPQSFRLALDQEIAPPSRKARSCGEHSRPNSVHEPSQSLVGRTPHSRRTAQIGDCGGAIHGGQIFASAPQTAFPDLANLPEESSVANRGHRFFHCADGDLPGPVRLRCASASATPGAALRGDGTSHAGVDHAADAGSVCVGRSTAVCATRSRCHLRNRLRCHDRSYGNGGSAYCPAIKNPFVERLVSSIRRECLDHVIVWNERSLRRTLQNYFAYYRRSRTHLSLR